MYSCVQTHSHTQPSGIGTIPEKSKANVMGNIAQAKTAVAKKENT